MKAVFASLFPRFVLRFAERLRFPQLFLLTLALFVVDLLLPDVIPFIDEILLALATLIIAAFRKPKAPDVARSEAATSGATIPGKAVRID